MKTTPVLWMIAAGLLIWSGCSKYPPAADRLTEDLVVITQYDTKADFNQYRTFDIADTIIKITSRDTTYLTDATALAIINQIASNMEARGFVKVAPNEKPDLGIQTVYFQNTYIYSYYYDWWGYYPYWYYYYPYYPVYYASYTAGALNIDLIDLKFVQTDGKKLTLRWNAYVRGLLTGTHTLGEINSRVDQAFIQTPQLQTTLQTTAN